MPDFVRSLDKCLWLGIDLEHGNFPVWIDRKQSEVFSCWTWCLLNRGWLNLLYGTQPNKLSVRWLGARTTPAHWLNGSNARW
jgi:hypothetical protein